MSNSVENNLKKQKDDSLTFLKQIAKEKSANISDGLFENIYDVVFNHYSDSSKDLSKEIWKLISNELEKKWRSIVCHLKIGWYLREIKWSFSLQIKILLF